MVRASQTGRALRSFRVGNRTYRCGERPYIMGILNVTPDSFFDAGRFRDVHKALDRARQMADEGADFIDIGGESSRPGAVAITEAEELERALPVIEKLAPELKIPVSIDTVKSGVARRALEAGAQMINDISALRADPEMIRVVRDYDATVILMHMQGEPRTMQVNPYYQDVISEVQGFLAESAAAAHSGGVPADKIIVDPGLGFGKRLGDNFELLRNLSKFTEIGPVLVGPSRKSFIGKVLDLPPENRLFGTAAAVAVAVWNGADVIRVHDVKEMVQVAEITYQCMTRAESRG